MMALEDTLTRLAEQKRIYLLVRAMVQALLAGCADTRGRWSSPGIATDGWFVTVESYTARVTVPERYGTTMHGRWRIEPHVLKAIDKALAWNGQKRVEGRVWGNNPRHQWFRPDRAPGKPVSV